MRQRILNRLVFYERRRPWFPAASSRLAREIHDDQVRIDLLRALLDGEDSIAQVQSRALLENSHSLAIPER
jgi:hypothetical protein